MGYTGDKKREYGRIWVANRRGVYFSDKYCSYCESTSNLELHHLSRETKVSHAVWSWSVAKRDEELKKCIILCSKCHLEETKKQLRREVKHSTHTAYANGCRCYGCGKAHAEYMKEYNRKKKEVTMGV